MKRHGRVPLTLGLIGILCLAAMPVSVQTPVIAKPPGAEKLDDDEKRRGPLGGPRRGDKPRKSLRDSEFDEPRPAEVRQRHQERVEKAMAVLKKELPAYFRRLQEMQRRNPREFQRVGRKVFPVMKEYIELKKENPELAETIIHEFRIEEELRKLSREFQNTNSNRKRRKLEQKMVQGVAKQMELRFSRRKYKLDQFARRLAQEKQRLKEDFDNRENAARRRVNQIKRGKFRFSLGEDDRKGKRPRPGPRGEQRRPPRDRPRP